MLTTPQVLLHQQVAALTVQLPAVMNGDVHGVHDGRIATRRIRELLPLTADQRRRDQVDDLYRRFRSVGRALGKVRDADVRVLLLQHLESRIPTAAPSLVLVRQQEEHRRLKLMRQLIKRLEGEDLPALLRETVGSRQLRPWWWYNRRRWQHQLEDVVLERAAQTVESVRHATGVYFPNRAHSARIAIKKLRYSLEIAEATRTLDAAEAVRDLRKAQDVLGDLHDRQHMLDELADSSRGDPPRPADQITLVTQVVEAEIHDLHARYLTRRDRVLATAQQLPHAVHRRLGIAPVIVAAGALAVSSGLVAARRQLAHGDPDHAADLR